MASDPKGLGAKFDAHTDAEFKTRDVEATMATMGEAPHVTHVPTMTGGSGYHAVRHFYENYFVGRVPDDWSVDLISRTVGDRQLVDEVMISFTHDCDSGRFRARGALAVVCCLRSRTTAWVRFGSFSCCGCVFFCRLY